MDNTICLWNVVLLQTCLYFLVQGSSNGHVTRGEYTMQCQSKFPEIPIAGPLTFSRTLKLQQCPVPVKSYTETLAALNFNTSQTDALRLYISLDSNSTSLSATHFQNLASIRTLWIDYGRSKGPRPTPDFLAPLTSLSDIFLLNMDLPPVSVTTITFAFLENGASLGEWGNCSHLVTLRLQNWDLSKIPEGWLSQCPLLTTVKLEDCRKMPLSTESLRRALFNATGLQTLKVYLSSLGTLPELPELKYLENLELNRNELQNIDSLIRSKTPLLKNLDLGSNRIQHANAVRLINNNPQLEVIELTGNKALDICKNINQNNTGNITIEHAKLRHLMMNGAGNTEVCFGRMESLRLLDLGSNYVKKLQFNRLPLSSQHLTVDLDNNPLEDIIFNKSDYETLRDQHYLSSNGTRVRRGDINISLNLKIDCGCRYGWLIRALKEFESLKINGITCYNYMFLTNVPSEPHASEKYNCLFEKGSCQCSRYCHDGTTVINCSPGNLERIPHVDGLRSIVARNNQFKTINHTDLPNTLLYLDLTSNRVSDVDAETAATLFVVRERIVLLADNPILCNCDNYAFIVAMQTHQSQVKDYNNVTCVGDNRPLKDVITDDLCMEQRKFWRTVGLVVGGIFFALIAFSLAIYARYDKEIKIFLYAKGLCLSCVREEELDADRYYDVFLSYAHQDEEYVVNELLAWLEDKQQQYKVCIHFRDWLPGEFIPQQITRSVEQSRRTIIVMSEHYLKSKWGLLEFRSAYEDALACGRSRIIVVLLEDVNYDNLDAELRKYLRNNTYVKRGDSWFWKKLSYALPHRRHVSVQLPQCCDLPELTYSA